MPVKLTILFALSLALHAEDAAPLATVEQLQKTVAEQSKQLAAKDQQIIELQTEQRLYQQGLFQCQAAEIHQQAMQQSKQTISQPKGKK